MSKVRIVMAVAAVIAFSSVANAGAYIGSPFIGQVSGCCGGGCGGCGVGTGCCLGSGCGLGCLSCGLGCLSGCGCGCFPLQCPMDCDDCSCNGSYNYPVPPQYTYHWPGCVYKQQQMTAYQSPWRFPPIKPFEEDLPHVDEVLPPATGQYSLPFDAIRPVSNLRVLPTTRKTGDIEPMSEKMRRHYR